MHFAGNSGYSITLIKLFVHCRHDLQVVVRREAVVMTICIVLATGATYS